MNIFDLLLAAIIIGVFAVPLGMAIFFSIWIALDRRRRK